MALVLQKRLFLFVSLAIALGFYIATSGFAVQCIRRLANRTGSSKTVQASNR